MNGQSISDLLAFMLNQDPALALFLVLAYVVSRHMSTTQANVNQIIQTLNAKAPDSKTIPS